MSIPPQEHYIGLSEPLLSSDETPNNLKETELRLGLPGSRPPERKGGTVVSLFGKDLKDESKCVKSGAKRGYSDALNGAGKWCLSINGGSEADKGKTEAPSGGSNGKKEIPAGEERKNEQPSNPAPASKAQVVGWPPIGSFRKKSSCCVGKKEGGSGSGKWLYVKVSMDGAPYLRKIDLKTYSNYAQLSSALENMFRCFSIAGKEEVVVIGCSQYLLTYQDNDTDWMLLGDVPWEMFTHSCTRLRIMKGSDAIGLAPRTMHKCKKQYS